MTLDLDALEALEKKATQGPWTPKCFAGENWQCVYPDEEHDTSIGSWENMALIAAARNALPELIRLARIGQRVERDATEGTSAQQPARPGPSQECVSVPFSIAYHLESMSLEMGGKCHICSQFRSLLAAAK